ncbi:hypothetical protein CYY_008629 [Polysphondylium violaceum]|uniref:WDHD1/CFT4 second beta-propeller domain-containing protein n=1 Tax=Polysphondylium violaceum TaxID=133409 RepID=A0A8J4PLE2_9MYCE|nr:hypothetical protein CYY_008629 [Polysphondylium violaceum]
MSKVSKVKVLDSKISPLLKNVNDNNKKIPFLYVPNTNSILYGCNLSNKIYYKDFDLEKDGEKVIEHHKKSDSSSQDKQQLTNSIISLHSIGENDCISVSDTELYIFSCTSPEETKKHLDIVSIPNHIQYSPTGTFIATASKNYIKVASTMDGGQINKFKAHEGQVLYVSYNMYGTHLASIGDDFKLKIWDTNTFGDGTVTPKREFELDCSKTNINHLNIEWSPTKLEIAVPSKEGVVLYSFEDENDLNNDDGDNNSSSSSSNDDNDKQQKEKYKKVILNNEGHSKEVIGVSYSPNGEYLASFGFDNLLFVWDLSNCEKEPISFRKHNQTISSLSWNPNQNLISFIDRKGKIGICNNIIPIGSRHPSNDNVIENLEVQNTQEEEEGQQEEQEQEDQDEKMNESYINDDEAKEVELEDGDDEVDYYENKKKLLDETAESYHSTSYPLSSFQKPFQIGSTFENVYYSSTKNKRYFLSFNLLGCILKREEVEDSSADSSNNTSSIEIEFHQTTYHRKLTFTDNQYQLGSLGSNGAIFSTKHMPGNTESTLLYKAFSTIPNNEDWTLSFSGANEGIVGVHVCDNFIIVVNAQRTVRVFSLCGTQLNLFSIPGDLVTINSHKNTVVIVHHAASFGSSQCLSALVLDLSTNHRILHDTLALSPNSTLSWIGFQQTTDFLTTYDSAGMIRILCYASSESKSMQWTPLSDMSKNVLESHWMVGLSKSEIYSIVCTATKEYPQTIPRPTLSPNPISIPLLPTVSCKLEQSLVDSKISFNNVIHNDPNQALLIREQAALDSAILRLFQLYIKTMQFSRAIELLYSLNLKKSFDIAFKCSNEKQCSVVTKKIIELKKIFVQKTYDQPSSSSNLTSSQGQSPEKSNSDLKRKELTQSAVVESNDSSDKPSKLFKFQ